MSNFNFCPLICHICSKTKFDKLEKVQFRALKFIFQDFNSFYDIVLQKAGATTLHLSRMKNLALQTFKIVYGDSPPVLQDCIVKKDTSYNFRYTNLLELPRPKSTRFRINSFRYHAPKLWNALPDDARKITDFDSFRSFIKGWGGVECRCAMCR